MKKEQKSEADNIEIGNLVSVPFGNTYLQGTVKDVNKDHLTIENYAAGQVKVPNNDLVYKFFPGQRFDIRELNLVDENSPDKLSTKEKLDTFLGKTQYKNFENLLKNHPKQVGQLLAGKLTSEVYKGSSLVQKPGEEVKTIVDWAAKFQLYRGSDKNLKLDLKFRSAKLDLKVYGKDLTKDETTAVLKEVKTITLDRTNKAGKDYKVFAKMDKDLNRIITSPYSKRVAERISKSVDKKEDLAPKAKQAVSKKPATKKQTGKKI